MKIHKNSQEQKPPKHPDTAMKTAYMYIRISDEDQSNFSLSGQEKLNNDYATKHGIQVIKSFIDDGYSAKNFNRPQWKELEKELSRNKHKIDYLIVTKYDRLIRNAAEGLAFIEKLEQKWNIKLLSVMENFFIDPHSPYFFKTRADLLVTAEFERRVISDRTKFGVWAAKSQGRFIGRAPLGYSNARDNEDKPILVVNNQQKAIVEQIFTDFLQDVPYQSIIQRVNARGVQFKGHDAIQRIISNYVYGGLIQTPGYKDETSKVVKGLHEPIIPEELFWRAYYKLQDKTRPQGPKVVHDEVPLRGFVMCRGCGGFHTGGKSKGRSQFYYYYRCKKCRGENYSANIVHTEMAQILKGLSLKEKYIRYLITDAQAKMEKGLKEKNLSLVKANDEYEALNEKLSSLEQKYIANKITQETYDKWYPTFSREVNFKKAELADLKKDDNEKIQLFTRVLPNLSDLTLSIVKLP